MKTQRRRKATTLDGASAPSMIDNQPSQHMTVSEAAARFRTSDRSVLRAIRAGELRAARLGRSRRWLVAVDDVERLLRGA